MAKDKVRSVALDNAARHLEHEMISQGYALVGEKYGGADSRELIMQHKLGVRLKVTIEYVDEGE